MKNTTLVWTLWISSVSVTAITALAYYLNFTDFEISDKPEVWGQFGDYFGGILNPLLAILNLIILTYLSLHLVKDEDERNKWTLQELVRPYADFNFDKGFEFMKIEVHNIGLGPMIITKIEISDAKGNIYTNFRKLIDFLNFRSENATGKEDIKIRSFDISNNHAAVGKDKKIVLLKILFSKDCDVSKEFVSFVKNGLSEFSIKIEYKDMYNRKMETLEDKIDFHY